MKRCPDCKCTKEDSEFHRNRASHDGLQPYCKICRKAGDKKRYLENPGAIKKASRKWRLKNPEAHRRWAYKNFGISLERYNQMLLEQGSVCAICNQPCESGRNLAIDHDHETGEIRGLLCTRCNVSLGGFLDRADLTTKATGYLLRFSTVPDSDWEL